jgi:hypothetical protein
MRNRIVGFAFDVKVEGAMMNFCLVFLDEAGRGGVLMWVSLTALFFLFERIAWMTF